MQRKLAAWGATLAIRLQQLRLQLLVLVVAPRLLLVAALMSWQGLVLTRQVRIQKQAWLRILQWQQQQLQQRWQLARAWGSTSRTAALRWQRSQRRLRQRQLVLQHRQQQQQRLLLLLLGRWLGQGRC
jgi:hypothetical protein